MLESMKATGNEYIYHRYIACESLDLCALFCLPNTPLISTDSRLCWSEGF